MPSATKSTKDRPEKPSKTPKSPSKAIAATAKSGKRAKPSKAAKPKKKAPASVQYAVLPFRRDEGDVSVLLITSRETRRWVLPKGWPMKGRKPHEAAAREAYEEAGLVGTVGRVSVGVYGYDKRMKDGEAVPTRVRVFPFEVLRRKRNWPERGEREDAWFAPADAAGMVDEEGLKEILLGFAPPPARKAARRRSVKAKSGKSGSQPRSGAGASAEAMA